MPVPRLLTITALAAVLRVAANDTAVILGAGGLIPTPASSIVMESEALHISLHQITVKYLFRNTSSRDQDLTVAFPLPEVDGGMVANAPMRLPFRDSLNFLGFEVLVDGKKVTPRTEVRSFLNGSEITSQLRSLGLPLSALDPNVTAAVNRLSPADRARLQKDGWVDCALTTDGKCWPYWQSRIQFYWPQHFPAGKTLEVSHTYRPAAGGGVMYGGDDLAGYPDIVKRYCPSTDDLAQVRQKLSGKKPDGEHPLLRQNEIEYILTTANNWRGPIRNFQLTVTSDTPEDTVATCLPGLKRIAPTRYEFSAANYRPDRELRLLIIQPAR